MKRKAAQSIPGLTELAAESPSGRQSAGQGSLYEEATGKTVDFIRYLEKSNAWPAFEARFTDGTFLFIEPVPQIQFRVRLLKASKGSVRTLRDYGVASEKISDSQE